MKKSFFVLCALLLSAVHAFGQPVVGTYKVISFDFQIDGADTKSYFGESPRGYIVLTKTLFISMLASESRRPGRSDIEKAALLDSMLAYTGPYHIDGNKLIVDVEASWTQVWTGKKQSRTWSMQGSRLTLVTDPAPYVRDPSKTVVATLVFEKIE